jgi:DHA2 family multidrug resistance protein
MLYLNKTHYGALRESISATDEIGQHATQIDIAQLTALAWREAEVMTFNNLFQIISFIFFSAILLAPLLKKVVKGDAVFGE